MMEKFTPSLCPVVFQALAVKAGHEMSTTLPKLADCIIVLSGFSGEEVNTHLFNLDKVPVADQRMIPPNLS